MVRHDYEVPHLVTLSIKVQQAFREDLGQRRPFQQTFPVSEIKELMDYGITRIYSPDDGREMGLQGMINDLVEQCDFPIGDQLNGEILYGLLRQPVLYRPCVGKILRRRDADII